MTTKSLTNTSVESAARPPVSAAAAPGTTYKKKTILVNRSVSPIRRRKSDEGFSEDDEVTRQYSKMRHKSNQEYIGNSRITQSVAEQRLSQAALEQQLRSETAAASGSTKHQPKPPSSSASTSSVVEHQQHDSGEYLEYIRTERKPSILNNKTSLISFDPKSTTLLRVHEHINEDEDGEEWSSIKSADDGYKEVMDCGIKMRAKRTTSQVSSLLEIMQISGGHSRAEIKIKVSSISGFGAIHSSPNAFNQ